MTRQPSDAEVPPAQEGYSITIRCPADLFDHLEEAPGPEDCIPYAEAQRLMAIAREHGDAALTMEQHNAIWDCLLAQPASQAWLHEQVTALTAETEAPADPAPPASAKGANS